MRSRSQCGRRRRPRAPASNAGTRRPRAKRWCAGAVRWRQPIAGCPQFTTAKWPVPKPGQNAPSAGHGINSSRDGSAARQNPALRKFTRSESPRYAASPAINSVVQRALGSALGRRDNRAMPSTITLAGPIWVESGRLVEKARANVRDGLKADLPPYAERVHPLTCEQQRLTAH